MMPEDSNDSLKQLEKTELKHMHGVRISDGLYVHVLVCLVRLKTGYKGTTYFNYIHAL